MHQKEQFNPFLGQVLCRAEKDFIKEPVSRREMPPACEDLDTILIAFESSSHCLLKALYFWMFYLNLIAYRTYFIPYSHV